jgi:hypothetical protein
MHVVEWQGAAESANCLSLVLFVLPLDIAVLVLDRHVMNKVII